MNNTSIIFDGNESEIYYCDERIEWTPARVQRVITLSILMMLSLLGNSIIIVILSISKTHRSLNRVNIFILNLAVGDLLIGIVTILSELILEMNNGEWILGSFGCKTLMPAQILTLSSTTYILVGMSKDRYQAICRPLYFNSSASRARKSVLIAWIAAFFSALPYVFIFVQTTHGIHSDGTDCYHCVSEGYTAGWQRKLNFIWLTLSVFLLPAIWIAFCYFSLARVVWQQSGDGLRKTGLGRIPRTKIKTLKMSLSIVITFLVCWSPYFVVYNLLIFSNYKIQVPETIIVIADTLALTNSVINPFLYSFFNMKIKQGISEGCCRRFDQVLHCCKTPESPHQHPQQIDSMSERPTTTPKIQMTTNLSLTNQINTSTKREIKLEINYKNTKLNTANTTTTEL